MAISPVSQTLESSAARLDDPALELKKEKFLSATKFAVVGASNNSKKWGNKVFKLYLDQHRDVVPINPKQDIVQGRNCLNSLADLQDPSETSVSIIVPPEATLKVLQQAKDLGVFFLWLQPGAERSSAVLQSIKDLGLEDRCIYDHHTRSHGLANTLSSLITTNLQDTSTIVHDDVKSPITSPISFKDLCIFGQLPSAVGAAVTSLVGDTITASPISDTTSLVAELSKKRKRSSDSAGTLTKSKTRKMSSLSESTPSPCSSIVAGHPLTGKFLSARTFAVVGASNNDMEQGAKILNHLLKGHENVVPINNTDATGIIQGVHCLRQLSDLPDPTHTSVSIAVPPKDTLEILQEAYRLKIFCLWLEPGAEGSPEVLKYITNYLEDRCIYNPPRNLTSAATPQSAQAEGIEPDGFSLMDTDTMFSSPVRVKGRSIASGAPAERLDEEMPGLA